MPLPALHHHKTFLHLVAFETMRFFAASPCKLRLGVVAFSFQGDCERIRVCQHVPLMWQTSTSWVAGVLLNTADLFSGFWQSCFLHSKQNMPFPSTNANHHIFVSEQKASSFLCNHSWLELPQSLEQLEHMALWLTFSPGNMLSTSSLCLSIFSCPEFHGVSPF